MAAPVDVTRSHRRSPSPIPIPLLIPTPARMCSPPTPEAVDPGGFNGRRWDVCSGTRLGRFTARSSTDSGIETFRQARCQPHRGGRPSPVTTNKVKESLDHLGRDRQ